MPHSRLHSRAIRPSGPSSELLLMGSVKPEGDIGVQRSTFSPSGGRNSLSGESATQNTDKSFWDQEGLSGGLK